MDDALLARLLAPQTLGPQIGERLALAGAPLLAATTHAIDAPGYLSDLLGVTLAWGGATPGPARAVLKVSHPGFGREELPFYREVAARLDCPVVPRFFAGGVDAPTQRTWILMEDLGASHERPSAAPVPPTFARQAAIVEALARFHAAGWGRRALAAGGATQVDRLRGSPWLEGALQRLFAEAGDALDERARGDYGRWFAGYDALVARVERSRGLTLVHGDAHAWNWLLPRTAEDGGAKLVDWDGWHYGMAAGDLAYLLALQCDPEVRRRFEDPLQDRYHAALLAAGVTGYPRAAFADDYRLAVLLHLRTPVARFHRGMSPYVWWPQLARVRQAVEDLRCMELLD